MSATATAQSATKVDVSGAKTEPVARKEEQKKDLAAPAGGAEAKGPAKKKGRKRKVRL